MGCVKYGLLCNLDQPLMKTFGRLPGGFAACSGKSTHEYMIAVASARLRVGPVVNHASSHIPVVETRLQSRQTLRSTAVPQ